MIIPVHISDNVQQCDIVPETADNSSDHLPISMTLNIQNPAGKSIEKSRSNLTSFPHGKWSNDRFKVQYCAKVKAALESWKPCEIEKVTSAEAGKVINDMCNSLCKLLHSCVSQCMESAPPKKFSNESKRWNYDCYLARRRNTTFHYIWKESGRPDSGLVYETYKHAKKNYRNFVEWPGKNKLTCPIKYWISYIIPKTPNRCGI